MMRRGAGNGGFMADCEKLGVCPFFTNTMKNLPNSTTLMKETYCHGDKLQCARYQVSVAGIAVPLDLFPNDREYARKILGIRFL